VLFNSYVFIFVFLPITFAGFFVIGARDGKLAALFLAAASLVFYGWSSPKYVLLLLGSVSINYLAALAIARSKGQRAKAVLIAAIAINLAILAYYKYAGFFLENWNALFHTEVAFAVLLPLGISFFTFTQISFLVDVFHGKVARYDPIHYLLFVTYFPHLIAGPILHHQDVIPQFERPDAAKPNLRLVSFGLVIFSIGLFKKTCLADVIQPYVTLAFTGQPDFYQAWLGALAYAFQIYFDFSGYSDMAVGLSLLFGVYLPINFNSPYKAASIVEFWRCWHMTLSRFLRDYLYIPLGGNRLGSGRRYLNLLITMVLGGLWHGPAWTFVAWGFLHGVYICINHGWSRLPWRMPSFAMLLGRPLSVALTFSAVVIAWVFFRADSLLSALGIVSRMFRPDIISWNYMEFPGWAFIVLFGAIVWLFPNTYAIVGYDHDARNVGRGVTANGPQMRLWLACFGGVLLAFGIMGIQQHSEFIYFRF
jgi:D-alanyl-lipoteichoic acid acyltransferase DltB (MBOAT superfamily)